MENNKKFIVSTIKESLKKPMSPYKNRIVLTLFCKEPKTISELQRDLGISYKETYRHIKELIKDGLLQRHREEEKKHAPVNITLTKKGKERVETITGNIVSPSDMKIEDLIKIIQEVF